jgi:hypothetical protein
MVGVAVGAGRDGVEEAADTGAGGLSTTAGVCGWQPAIIRAILARRRICRQETNLMFFIIPHKSVSFV